MITVITVTIGGRDFYLRKAIQSVLDSVGKEEIQHIIVFNGTTILNLAPQQYNYDSEIIQLTDRTSIGEALNATKDMIKGDLVLKMDDDCLIQSKNFFDHARAVNILEPRICFSPFPVGLIGNLGGVQSNERKVIYSLDTDTYYTLRKVNHIGGFARFCPSLYAKNITFIGKAHDEDGQFSTRYNNLGMYYLENSLIVEHQESTLGQHERYKNYFEERF